MKVFVAMLAAAGFMVAAYVLYALGTLRGDQANLDGRVKAALNAVEDLAGSRPTAEDAARWDAMDSRLAHIEESLRATPAEDRVGDDEAAGADLATIQTTLLSLGEEIAEIRSDLEGVRRVRGALDSTADRLLGAVGQDAGAAEGGQGGGMERLMELGSLFQRREEDLTPEERARRDEITNQLRTRQSEWALQMFDRSLEVKLNEQQKADLQQLLDEERTAIAASRTPDMTAEERTAARRQAEAQTDQKAAAVLSTEQYESWKTYRARSGGGAERAAGLRRFGQGR